MGATQRENVSSLNRIPTESTKQAFLIDSILTLSVQWKSRRVVQPSKSSEADLQHTVGCARGGWAALIS